MFWSCIFVLSFPLRLSGKHKPMQRYVIYNIVQHSAAVCDIYKTVQHSAAVCDIYKPVQHSAAVGDMYETVQHSAAHFFLSYICVLCIGPMFVSSIFRSD